MTNKIPIFPLNLVVFPKSKYPLHIFEERYKLMINRCLETGSFFGICTIVNEEISKVGGLVKIYDVIKKHEDGELDIIVEGVSRFKIVNLEMHPDGYYEAEIEKFADLITEIDPFLLEKLQKKFEEILEKFNFQLEDTFWTNYKSTDLKSFKLAEKSGLSIEQQQVLLSLQNENTRLNFLIEHFNVLTEQISRSATLKSIIMSDGYIN